MSKVEDVNGLKEYWEEYGHDVKWNELFDMKIAHHNSGGIYVCFAWIDNEKFVNYADLSFDGNEWCMLNDAGELITRQQWKSAEVKPECDWLWNPKTGKDL